jgi:hypothetical protein
VTRRRLLTAAVIVGLLALLTGVAALAHTIGTAEPPGTYSTYSTCDP